jgi:sugar/nucleoside kinase (ribokinase family)
VRVSSVFTLSCTLLLQNRLYDMKRLRSDSDIKHLDLVTFGEAMLTYKPVPPSTCSGTPLTTGASQVVQAVGGAELNTAVAVSLVGKKAAWASVLPTGPLGKVVVDAAAAAGLELAAPYVIEADGATIGTVHVVDDGAGSRPHYQRSHSAFCRLIDGDTFGWDALLRPAKWLHVTGITPPLGIGPLAAWRAAVRAAGPVGALVSLDLNWRPALGPFDELWALVLPELRHVTLLILSEADLVRLGCTAPQHAHACMPWLAAARAAAHRSRGLSACSGPSFAQARGGAAAVCGGVRRCAAVCGGVRRCAAVCGGVRRCAAVCGGVRRRSGASSLKAAPIPYGR